jgi:hypothetical protein
VNAVAVFLVEDCFWSLFDRGIAAERTPLLTGVFEGSPLADTLCHRFGISLEEAEFEIKAARSEVEL